MKRPLVSIIVPNYNHANYLQIRLASILHQTYKNFEIILMDDASTDGSIDIINAYRSNKKIRIIINKENSGNAFIQWNKGISQASGEFIWIAESDDYAHIKFLSTLIPIIEKNKKIGIIYCQSHVIDEDNQIIGLYKPSSKTFSSDRWSNDFFAKGHEEIINYLLFENTIPNASAIIFRKSSFDEAGGANANYLLNGDWDLWIRILLNNDLVYVAQPLNYFRQHQQSVRSKKNVDGTNMVEYSELLKKGYGNLILDKKQKKLIIQHFILLLEYYRHISIRKFIKIFFNLFFFYPNILLFIIQSPNSFLKRLLKKYN